MAPPVDPELIEFATEVVSAAGALTLEAFERRAITTQRKGDGTPVTETDRAAEALMRQLISERFPDDTIIGEEHADQQGSSGRRWIIDPIDGTESFARGVILYTNLLALEDEHGTAVGVINVPAIGELIVAGRGRGAFFNGSPCHVSQQTSLSDAMLTASGFEWWPPDMLSAIRSCGVGIRTWGDGYGYLLVATGRADIMVDPEISHWDIAPCGLIVNEAGGRWSTLEGHTPDVPTSFVATNGHLHDQVLKVLAS